MLVNATPEEFEAAARLRDLLRQTLVSALDHEALSVYAVVIASVEFVAETITPLALGQSTAEDVEAFLAQTTESLWMAVHRNIQRHREQHPSP